MEIIICLQTKITNFTKASGILLFFLFGFHLLVKVERCYLLVFCVKRRFIFIYIVIGDWHASEAVEVRMTKVWRTFTVRSIFILIVNTSNLQTNLQVMKETSECFYFRRASPTGFLSQQQHQRSVSDLA